jgi:hypothetical protein
MAEPARYWPGGIPENVRFHPEPIIGPLKEEIKGWQLFLEVIGTSHFLPFKPRYLKILTYLGKLYGSQPRRA